MFRRFTVEAQWKLAEGELSAGPAGQADFARRVVHCVRACRRPSDAARWPTSSCASSGGRCLPTRGCEPADRGWAVACCGGGEVGAR